MMEKRSFNQALRWHMDQSGVSVADLASSTGVSVNVIKKLRSRPEGGTGADNAAKIAAYFGKDVRRFIRCEESSDVESVRALIDLLSEDEQRLIVASIRGILASREDE